MMKITTETGSVYDIDSGGVCRKYRDGNVIDSFKPYFMRSVPDTVKSLEEIYELPESELKIGDRLYISGLNNWWISTKMVRIEH